MDPKSSRGHIAVLDGFRAYAMMALMCFHFWQQSWLSGVNVPFLKNTSLWQFPPYEFFRSGSAMVDLLLLLSGFLLFLPYARSMCGDTVKLDSPLRFYQKRVGRIVPSVYFHMAFLMIFFIRVSDYGGSTMNYARDVVRHLFFMQDLPFKTVIYSPFTGTLWTLTVEVIFYLMFPFLARLFRKQPYLTFTGMLLAGEAYIRLYAEKQIEMGNTAPHRQWPAYFGVYAVGMMAALIYEQLLHNDCSKKKWFGWTATGIAVLGLYAMIRVIWYGYGRDGSQYWQVDNRLLLAMVSAITMVALCFSKKFLQWIFANPFTHFMATISFNLYIWHQFFSIYLKKWHLPAYPEAPAGASAWPQSGDFVGKTAWQWKYTALMWLFSIAAAAFVTYCIEKPCAKWINSWGKKRCEARMAETPMPEIKTEN